MKNLYFVRRGSALVPATDETAKRIMKIKEGQFALCEVVVPRNINFHRKYFALLNFGFQYFEPNLEPVNGLMPQIEFERFRKDVAIMAGWRTVVVNIKGETRLEAKSISFGRMQPEEFEKLYKASFNVIWELVLSRVHGMKKEEAESLLAQAENFA